jgi:hypothetical protein
MTHVFSPEVHVFASTLVPVVSTNCWYLLMQIEYEGFRKCIKYHCSILPRVFQVSLFIFYHRKTME